MDVPDYAPDVPAWIRAIDTAAIALLNVSLAIELLLVFANTAVRTLFNSSLLMGVDETSPLFLITLAFLGGAVAYSRGQFIAITLLIDRAPRAWNEFFKACAEWIVIIVSLLIGGYSIPLLIANAEEKTILLGIGYIWMTLPITVGSALLIARAGLSLFHRSGATIVGATIVVWGATLVFVTTKAGLGAHPALLYWTLGVTFFGLVATGIPVGFVLAVVGIGCVQAIGSADMIAVVMNAQRGAGGFIFLALPFFILAGFIMDRADVGGRIVEFVGSLIGHLRGGLLQVMIVGVYISSCISGSKAADMATIGLPMNRKLEEHGYEAEERAALLAAAAAMAESVPPSIALILLGSATAISTGALFVAGVLPAATIAVLLMAMVWGACVVREVEAAAARQSPRNRARRQARAAAADDPGNPAGRHHRRYRHTDRSVDVRRALQPRARHRLQEDEARRPVVVPHQRIAAERDDLLHGERRDDFLVGADARRRDDRDRRHGGGARAGAVPAGGDPDHDHHGHGARELRHDRDPRSAAAAGGAATGGGPAAIRDHHDRSVCDRLHPAAGGYCALCLLCNQRCADRKGEPAPAVLLSGADRRTAGRDVRADDHDDPAEAAELQILIRQRRGTRHECST
jgi:TRAP-type C4-dicarboxylate transport system permease small subunit